MQETEEPAPEPKRSRRSATQDAARLALIVALVLGAPIALQVLRRQVPVIALLVVLGLAAGALMVAALAARRQR